LQLISQKKNGAKPGAPKITSGKVRIKKKIPKNQNYIFRKFFDIFAR